MLGDIFRKKKDFSKTFDWDKAIDIIVKNDLKTVQAGLEEDFPDTQGYILMDGEPVTEQYHFLESLWATPVLLDTDTGEFYPCWVYSNMTNYNADSDWTKELWDKFDKLKNEKKEENLN